MNNLKEKMSNIEKSIKEVIDDITKEHLENSQEVLDFMDRLNAYSITF